MHGMRENNTAQTPNTYYNTDHIFFRGRKWMAALIHAQVSFATAPDATRQSDLDHTIDANAAKRDTHNTSQGTQPRERATPGISPRRYLRSP